MCVFICLFVYVYSCTYILYTYKQKFICICTYVCIYIRRYRCMPVRTHIHTYEHTYIYNVHLYVCY